MDAPTASRVDKNLRDRECDIARRALRVFAAATWRLRARRRAAQ